MLNIPPENKPIDYDKNLSNIDALLSELNTEKQDFTPKPPPQTSGFDPTNDFLNQSKTKTKTESGPLTAAEWEAKLDNGKDTAEFIDGLLSMGAQYIAKAGDSEKYKAAEVDINKLGNAWAKYTKYKDFNIPPWAMLLVLNVTVYMPKITAAFNDRRFGELDKRVNKLETDRKDPAV